MSHFYEYHFANIRTNYCYLNTSEILKITFEDTKKKSKITNFKYNTEHYGRKTRFNPLLNSRKTSTK